MQADGTLIQHVQRIFPLSDSAIDNYEYRLLFQLMSIRKCDIELFVKCEGKDYTFLTYTNEYRSLMTLIYDKIYVENFGDCKGIGRCGTCHVHLLDYEGELLKREGNEQSTLDKMPVTERSSRLSCQILIDEKINGLRMEVVDDGDLGLY
jgi:ferredoxin, 2Fe-2S